uniref:Tyrosine-protein phosphatase domain-containing protein n=1 Tax=Panagrolaimus sp. ES5 TaxID=591445 RepID=A0AC34FSU0_9BILA
MKNEEALRCERWTRFKGDKKVNRYSNISCNDSNLVGIKGVPFFNGNYIKNGEGQKLFIATQAPLNETVEAFWKVVLQEKISVVVMLCSLFEPDLKERKHGLKQKCAIYYPTDMPLKFEQFYIVVTNIREELYADGWKAAKKGIVQPTTYPFNFT